MKKSAITESEIDEINHRLWNNRYSNATVTLSESLSVLAKAIKSDYQKGMAYSRLNAAACSFLHSENDIAMENLTKAQLWFSENQSEPGYVRALNLKGNLYESFGEYERALQYCLQAHKLSIEIVDRETEAETCSQLGLIYTRLCDFSKALEYYLEGFKIRAELKDENAMASSLNRIGMIKRLTGKYNESLEYYFKSLVIRRRNKQASSIPWTLLGIASTYEEMHNTSEALEYYEQGMVGGDRRCTLQCIMGSGRIFSLAGQTGKAEERLGESLRMAQDLKALSLVEEAYAGLADHYESTGQFEEALRNHKLYQKTRESVQSDEVQNRLRNIEISYAIEKSEHEKEIYRLRHIELKEAYDLVEKQNQKITELDQIKSRFFTNISHEFRTPLSLIQSPVDELLDDRHSNEKQRRKLNMVQRNVRRLLNLVNQLLDIAKIDGSKMKLELIESDVMKYLKAISGAFTSMAETKNIRYHCHFMPDEILSWFDPDKLEKIATNLLSNAFKFTPDGGEIEFRARYLKRDDSQKPLLLEFSVKDTGNGIPQKSLGKIFDRFYQLEESVKPEGGGTGIGLSLARDLARLLHGDITVGSELSKGSIFSVQILLGKDHLNESEYIIMKNIPETFSLKPDLNEEPEADALSDREVRSVREKPVILLVEDNRDIRMQLSDNLTLEYVILEATNGVAGLKKATETIPDLVITDLMMPLMDGIELCHKLKTDLRTSHIPVIMLTAKATLEDKITGLQTGADDYIPKPFQMAEVKAKVSNLIEQRKKLRERFSREITLEPRDISITPLDEQFLIKAIEVVERHMNDEDFGLDDLIEDMNMSRSTLFRKLHALTDQSPTEFIRNLRLKRAANLLKQNFGNVTQVSLEVGFSSLSYFNRSFKKLYGLSPVEYIKLNYSIKARDRGNG